MNRYHLLSFFWGILCLSSCKESESVADEVAFGISSTTQSVAQTGGTLTINVTTEAAIEITTACPDWITQENVAATGNGQKFTFTVAPNNNANNRIGDILFTATAGSKPKTVQITQKGRGDYSADEGAIEEVPADVKILKIIDAYSKQGTNNEGLNQHRGGNVNYLYDGNLENVFQSPWSEKWFGKTYDPWTKIFDELHALLGISYYELEFSFADHKEEAIDYMIYYPRPEDNKGGVFGKVTIEASTFNNPTEFIVVAEGDCGMKPGTPAFIYFDAPVKNPHTIRLKVHNSHQNYISAAEIEFYGKSDAAFDTSALFADPICSALKEGVTLEDIEACEYPFFKNIATYMYYNRDEYANFRINEFKAYPHPDVQAKENKTSTYSLLDNPTGISVTEGSTLVLWVSNIPSAEAINLRIVNFNTPGEDGWHASTTYPLRVGLNKLKMSRKGLVYVMYHTPHYETVAPVKIHFASGAVNGYFDGTKNTSEEWRELLNKSVHPYFDIIGKYAHVIFPVENLKKEKDGKGYIQFFDDLVYNEQDFQGLVKYDRMFKNRMLFNVFYNDSYMYAAGYHTGYNVSTMDFMCSLEELKKDCWGPAHEVGHSNQTRPGLKWNGMTEVTNNILSMYIQQVNGIESRLERKGDYEAAMISAFVNNMPHIHISWPSNSGESLFCQLVPFWQLYLYLAKVANKPDFYKDLYEEVRKTDPKIENARNAGEQQIEFAYTCCKIAQLDLTDFFENWGFIREVKATSEDYEVPGTFDINAQDVADMKARIKALGYQKPVHDFKYICESNLELYKSNQTVTSGSAIKNGNAIQIVNCKAVVYKVYNKSNNKLIYVSPKAVFEVPNLPSSINVMAVAANGTEISLSVR